MPTRRSFLAGAACTAPVVVLSSFAQSGYKTTPEGAFTKAHPSHTTYGKTLVKHFARLAKDPMHDPWMSGELAANFRAHCESMEANGVNAMTANTIRSVGATPLTADAALPLFGKLKTLGIVLPVTTRTAILDTVNTYGRSSSNAMQNALQTASLLQVQQTVHRAMLTKQLMSFHRMTAGQTIATALPDHHQGIRRVSDAVYHPGMARLVRSGYQNGDGPVAPVGGPSDNPDYTGGWLDINNIETKYVANGGYIPQYYDINATNGDTAAEQNGRVVVYDANGNPVGDMPAPKSCSEWNADVAKLFGALSGGFAALSGIGFVYYIPLGVGVGASLPELAALAALFAVFAAIASILC